MAPQTQAPQKMEFAIRPYRADNPADENALIALINTCYRTRESWTNETNFVSGQRVNAKQMRQHAKEMPIFVAEEVTDGEAQVVACIKTGLTSHTEVTKLNNPAGYVALFAVHPRVQRRGLGRKLMLHAESFCRTLGADEMVLDVLDLREDIVRWYNKQGYVTTSISADASKIVSATSTLLVPASFVLMRKSITA